MCVYIYINTQFLDSSIEFTSFCELSVILFFKRTASNANDWENCLQSIKKTENMN